MHSSNLKIAMLLALTTIVACKKDRTEWVSFNGQMENMVAEADSTKTYITDDEKWVYWELGDKVTICQGNDTVEFAVMSGEGTLSAIFNAEVDLNEHPNILLASPNYMFSPNNLNPRPTNAEKTSWAISLPHVQPYRTGTSPHPDHSFSSDVLPMVAYSPNVLTEPYFYFHPVSGILRLQFYSSSATAVVIDSITIDGKSQLAGDFTLPRDNALGIPAIQDPEPFIVPTNPQPGDSTITITGINKPVGGFDQDKLYTFYVPLPATKDLTAEVSSVDDYYTSYKLRVTVHGHRAADAANVQCIKILQAKIHRCNITKMRALDLESFSLSGNGTSTPQLVGNGTKDRPFQIYTYDDLVKVRDAFESSTPRINGQLVRGMGHPNGPTYFKICRSGIELPLDGVWTTGKGIKNFKGYMYVESSMTHGNIINYSRYAFFESISDSGKVEGLYLDGNVTTAVRRDEYSPFCYINRGVMLNCHNACDVVIDVYNSGNHAMHLAGLCAINYGSIIGGVNSGDLRSDSSDVAGVCYNNYGTIQGSSVLSSAVPIGKRIAGVAFNNESSGIVKECLVAANIDPAVGDGDIGLIVFSNRGVITTCRAAGSLVYSANGSVGGICNTNYATVKNCSNTVSIVGCHISVGGIVAINEAGEVYNCDSEGDHEVNGTNGINTADYAGGIVGWLKGGKVVNSYNHSRVTSAYNSGGVVGMIEMAAYEPDLSQRPVQNCWSGYSYRLHGFIYDTICKIGNSCFSSAGSDFDTLKGCNIFSLTDFLIDTVLATYTAYTGGAIGVNSPLVDALNFWVNTEDPSHSKYMLWSVSAGDAMPRLSAVAKSKGLRATAARVERLEREISTGINPSIDRFRPVSNKY